MKAEYQINACKDKARTTAQNTSEGAAKVLDQVKKGPEVGTGFCSLTSTAPREWMGARVVMELCDEIIPDDMVRFTKPLFVPPDAWMVQS